MKNKYLTLCIVSVAFLLWFNVRPAQATVMMIGVSSGSTSVGQDIAVDISATDASDLSAFQFDIAFDPTILRADSIIEGPFLAIAGSTFFVPGTIDNIGGIIQFNLGSLIGTISGVTGSGVLETIVFHALQDGTSSLALSNIAVLDSSSNDMEFASLDGSVVVGQGNPVPEPSTFVLMIFALLSVCVRCNRNSRAYEFPIYKRL